MNIPVTMNYNDQQYDGILTKVAGSGNTSTFHLMIDNYYYGRLRYSEFQKRWVFDRNNKETDIGYLFPKHVTDLANQEKLFISETSSVSVNP